MSWWELLQWRLGRLLVHRRLWHDLHGRLLLIWHMGAHLTPLRKNALLPLEHERLYRLHLLLEPRVIVEPHSALLAEPRRLLQHHAVQLLLVSQLLWAHAGWRELSNWAVLLSYQRRVPWVVCSLHLYLCLVQGHHSICGLSMVLPLLLPLLSFLVQSFELCCLTLLRQPAEFVSFVLFERESLVEIDLLEGLVDFACLDVGEALPLGMLLYLEAEPFCNCRLSGLEHLDTALLLVQRLELGEHGPLSCAELLLIDLLEALVVKIKLLPHLLQVEVQERARVLRFFLGGVELPRSCLL